MNGSKTAKNNFNQKTKFPPLSSPDSFSLSLLPARDFARSVQLFVFFLPLDPFLAGDATCTVNKGKNASSAMMVYVVRCSRVRGRRNKKTKKQSTNRRDYNVSGMWGSSLVKRNEYSENGSAVQV